MTVLHALALSLMPVLATSAVSTASASGRTVQAGPGTTVVAGPGAVVQAGTGRTVEAGPGLRQGVWQTFGVLDGLAGIEVLGLAQDRDGTLWVSTRGGLCRYDGRTFTTFTTRDGLPHDRIGRVLVDRDGHVWFGSQGGLTRYDGVTFTTYTTADGLGHNGVFALYEDRRKNLWFGVVDWANRTGFGVTRYDGQSFTTFTQADGLGFEGVTAITEDREGNLWFGGLSRDGNGDLSGVVSLYDGSTFTIFDAANSPLRGWVYDMAVDRKGRMWLATDEGPLRYDGESFQSLADEDRLEGKITRSIHVDSAGQVWLGSMGYGISRYDGEGYTPYTKADGLSDGHINSILEDRDGQMWFGTVGSGLMRYDGGRVRHFTELRNGARLEYVRGMVADAGQPLLVRGVFDLRYTLARFDGRAFGAIDTSDAVSDVAPDRAGGLWLALGEEGLGHDAGDGLRRIEPEALRGVRVDDLLLDHEGRLWVGGSRKEGGGFLGRMDGRTWTILGDLDLLQDRVGHLFEDRDGRVWCVTGAGIVICEADSLTSFSAWTAEEPPSVIFQDTRGDMWFGTSQGAHSWDGTSWRLVEPERGMNGGWIVDIGQDSEGRMLFTHYGGGVHVYDGQVMQTLTRRNFLLSDAVKSVWPEENGSIWIGGDAGLTRYRPTRTPPAIDILQVIADRAYDGDTPISLPSTQELLTIELAATSLTNPEGFVYRHRLLGQDTTWQTTRIPRVTYRDLPRGDYTFEVQAVDLDLNRSEPVRLALQVHLPYERFTWVGALLLAVGLLAWQTTRVVVRDRRLRVSNRTLEQQNDELAVARDRADAANQAKSDFLANMSHEIRTPMNAILGFAQILERRTDLAADLREPVQTIQRSGEHLLRLINEVLDLSKIEAGRMELHPRDFDLNGLLDGLASMFAMRCGDKDLDWRLLKTSEGVLPVHGDEAKLSQVLINLLGNAVKFTEAGKQVWLTVRDAGDGSYRFEVGDTGRGIEAASLERIFEPFEQGSAGLSEGGTGLGLAITKRLLRLMGAELAVDSVVGRGSCFSFELELPPGRIPDETSDETRWQRVRRLAAGHTVDALIVDDVPENREILAGLLEGIGVTVRTADGGSACLSAVAERRPDIVLLDMRMPGMSGGEVARRIWQNNGREKLKIVAVSASVLDHERLVYREQGFDEFLDKPVRAGQLFGCLARLLGVEYEFEEVESAAQPLVDFSGLKLPVELLERLRQAAATANMTRLMKGLDELERLGDDERQLSGYLRELGLSFAMGQVEEVLRGLGE